MSDPGPEFADEGGEGAKKSFWEHLQDLRTALIRSAIAIGIALVICLLLSQQIVQVLEYPLRRMEMFETPKATLTLEVGDAKLGPYPVSREQFPALPPGAAPHAVFRLGSAEIGGRQVAVLEPDPKAEAAEGTQVRLHNFSPTEAFMVAFHVGLYAAVGVSLPFWAYFLGGFIVPALNFRERKLVFSWMGWGALLFVIGVLGTYFFLLPIALRASVKYSDLLGFSAGDWRADEYIDFACKFLFGMGVGFQFPLVVLGMVKLGIINHRHLAKYRRHVIILCLILGAVLTTPEPITQIAMAVPLYLLYEICIWIAWYWDWKKRRAGAVES
ncbi:MAG TPA: twin-arginine translocase subunit TatC [Opitutaceae bacterium]|nr:twin-arginine translocase subunit TatC [Opitutaceae bacterium]